MPRRVRLRDYFGGRREPPRSGGSDPAELMREVEAAENLDPGEVVRLCRQGQVRVWERIEETVREEGRRGE